MDQANGATQDELQQAINSITNGGGAAAGADPVADIANKVAEQQAATLPPAPAPSVPAAPAMPSTVDGIPVEPMKAMYGDPDLDKVKSMALSDLRPILEKVDISPDKKFMIYKDIIDLTEDKACIEPAYNAARLIEDEKAKGEALVYIVECIDKLGIQMTIGTDQQQTYLIQENTTTPPVVFLHLRDSFLIVVALILCGIFGGCNCGVAGADACFGRDFLWIEAEDF